MAVDEASAPPPPPTRLVGWLGPDGFVEAEGAAA
jgi:hypothetical protein